MSPLLKLPVELRVKIYEYAFTNSTVHISLYEPSGTPRRPPPKSAALLYISRQIKYEAFSVFISTCTFDITSCWFWDRLVKVVGAHNLKLMTSLLAMPGCMLSLIEHIDKADWELLQSLRHVSVLVDPQYEKSSQILLRGIRCHFSREMPCVTIQEVESSAN